MTPMVESEEKRLFNELRRNQAMTGLKAEQELKVKGKSLIEPAKVKVLQKCTKIVPYDIRS